MAREEATCPLNIRDLIRWDERRATGWGAADGHKAFAGHIAEGHDVVCLSEAD